MQSNEELKAELKNILDKGEISTSTARANKSRLSEAARLCSMLHGENIYDCEKISGAADSLLEAVKESDPNRRNNLIADALWNIEQHAK